MAHDLLEYFAVSQTESPLEEEIEDEEEVTVWTSHQAEFEKVDLKVLRPRG